MATNRQISAIAACLWQRPPKLGACRLLVIDGPAGSGKTTLAQKLAAELEAPLIHADDLYAGWDGLAQMPEDFVTSVLLPISQGQAGAYRRWDWEQDTWGEEITVQPTALLIAEGVGMGDARIRSYAAVAVFVTAAATTRQQRALARGDFGRTRQLALRQYQSWRQAEQEIFAASKIADLADFRIFT